MLRIIELLNERKVRMFPFLDPYFCKKIRIQGCEELCPGSHRQFLAEKELKTRYHADWIKESVPISYLIITMF